jgi:hypothetical protein
VEEKTLPKKRRKSPRRHRVKTHIRDGHRVRAHYRGHSTPTGQTKRKIKKRELRHYTVELTYADGKKEIDHNLAYSVTEALTDARLHRKRKSARVVEAKIKNSEVVKDIKTVMEEIASKGGRVARTAAGVIDDVQDEGDRYTVEDEWR